MCAAATPATPRGRSCCLLRWVLVIARVTFGDSDIVKLKAIDEHRALELDLGAWQITDEGSAQVDAQLVLHTELIVYFDLTLCNTGEKLSEKMLEIYHRATPGWHSTSFCTSASVCIVPLASPSAYRRAIAQMVRQFEFRPNALVPSFSL